MYMQPNVYCIFFCLIIMCNFYAKIMQVFVSLYWGGKIVQLPHLGIGYDPPCSRDGIVFDSCVSYSELFARICATVKIDMNQHTIELSWKHSIGKSYICTGIHNDQSVMYMFKEAQTSTGHIDLIDEYTSVRNSRRQPTVDCGISSARVKHVSVDCGTTGQEDVADVVDFGMNDQVDMADVADADRHHPDISSASSEGSFSDEYGGGNVSSDDEIIYNLSCEVNNHFQSTTIPGYRFFAIYHVEVVLLGYPMKMKKTIGTGMRKNQLGFYWE